jgi:hypothetical protein
LSKQQNKPLQQRFLITEEIYNLLKEYEELVMQDRERKTFFSYRFYKLCYLGNRDSSGHKKLDPDCFNRGGLDKMLKIFEKKVIDEIYNYKVIEKTNATLDLNELDTISVLGGHDSLDAQLHYSSNSETLVESSIQILSQSLLENINIHSGKISNSNFSKKNVFIWSSLGDEFYDLPKVPGGRCRSKNIPYECHVSECMYCIDHFVFDDKDRQLLYAENRKLEREIRLKLKFIEKVFKSTNYGHIDGSLDEELKSNANSLSTLVKQKALVEAYKHT